MSKPISEFSGRELGAGRSDGQSNGRPNGQSNGRPNGNGRSSPLAELVHERLRTKGMRQVDFCRDTGFDQGLLSKILSSVVNTLNVETALRLAEGLGLPPTVVFEAIGKKDVDDMLRRFYRDSDSVM